MWHILLGLLLIAAAPARGDTWWTRYEAQSGLYPEEAGWTRYASNPPAQRWFEDGKLFIDSRAASGITEGYHQFRPGQMTLGPGERLLMSWRVKVEETLPAGRFDPGIAISSDGQWEVLLLFSTEMVMSAYEPGNYATFTAGAFHLFEFQSSDLRTYQLSIDGMPALQGVFFQSLFYSPGVGWGDLTTARSLSAWDYVEGGIVPEPSTSVCVLGGICACRLLNRSATRRCAVIS